jgi:SPP1 family predicted phage head-tail adaptor
MRAGNLQHSITIQQKALTVDVNGDRTEAWTTYLTCWASIETGNGREFFAAKQIMADLTHTVRIRYYAGLRPDMRVAYTDQKTNVTRYFNIRAILNPDERNEMLVLQATEVLI